ncbi:cell cycle control protein 50A-like isoform X1 [Choristoneura fumiferana]|uniref:cell cycle control protein 50A-like isoform X1 n=1 Tax=Choristoneura fumiferana TaxID=7141 RepID=UPI003D155436
MESQKPTLGRRVLNILPFILIAGLVLVPVGIGFLCAVNTTDTVKEELEYFQNCRDEDYNYPCNNIPADQSKCSCTVQFNLTQDITGDITVYYELVTFDQTDSSYANSRDNDQLSGHPSAVPSTNCGDFRYDQDKPIFPCGKIADTMFNDSFTKLSLQSDPEKPLTINITYDGLLTEDTITYHNPPADVWANFTKPRSWLVKTGNVWEIGPKSIGVENPAFRAWMNTNLKRKPVWKVADNILPTGPYKLFIDIFYPAQAYNGSRKFIIEGVYPISRLSYVIIGSLALIVGIIALVFSLVLIIISKRQEKVPSRPSSYNASTLPVSDKIIHRPQSTVYEDISEEAKLNTNH